MKQLSFRSGIAAAVAAAFGVGLMTDVALAQQPPAGQVQRVEVTGSNIKRIEGEGSLPVQVITREDIEKSGSGNVEQFLQSLGVAVQGNSNSGQASAAGANTAGVAGVSLRGLSSFRTLVLIDGRRVSAGGTPTDSVTVDVNLIPASAIERIEVLKDGASAIYGSDAIGGVINFILRKDYKGGEVTGFYGQPTESPTSHGSQGRISGVVGFGDIANDGFNVTLIANYAKDKALFGRDRSFASTGIFPDQNNTTSSGNTFPGNITPITNTGVSRNPSIFAGGTACPGPYSVLDPFFPPNRCRFDPAPLVNLVPETETTSLIASGRWKLMTDLEAYGQFSYVRKEQRTVLQPAPVSDQFSMPANHPFATVFPYNIYGGLQPVATILSTPASPFYPFNQFPGIVIPGVANGDTLFVRYRSAITGPRDITDIAEQPRVVLGLKGNAWNWDWDASFLHTETTTTERVNSGIPLYSRILPLLNSGTVNLFGPNTPAIEAQVKATEFIGDAYKTKNSIDSVTGRVSKDLWQLPGGPLALALGIEGRKEKFKLDPAAELQIGDVSHYGGNTLPVDRQRNVSVVFAEVNMPLHKQFETTVALRYDDYEGVGAKYTPKISARWTPRDDALVRGSWGQGFRAPSLTDLFQPQTLGVTVAGLSDPQRCPVTTNGNDCNTQFPVTLGGNQNLKSETSTNRTLGFVLEPIKNFSVGVDFFWIDLKNTIAFGVDPAFILTSPAFAGLITRAPCSAADLAAFAGSGVPCVGQIIDINQTNLNLGATKVQGIDIDLRYRLLVADWGTFKFGLNATQFNKYKIQGPDGEFIDVKGAVSPIVQGVGGVIPTWRHYLYADWTRGPWNLNLANNFQKAYRDIPGTADDPADPVHRKVDSYSTWNIFGSYSGWKDTRIVLGIRNLFDDKPPYTNAGGQNYFQSGYDPGYVDPRGRFWYASLTWKFK